MSFNIQQLSNVDTVFYSLFKESPDKQTLLFVFDEIHKILGWEDLILRLKKKKNHLVLITGSTSELEEDKVGRQLRGKTFTKKIYPLSFLEFLRFKGNSIDLNRLGTKESIAIEKLFIEYLSNGSYPAISQIPPSLHRDILQNYFNSIVASDFIFNKNISNPQTCKSYLKFLMQQNSSPYSHKKLFNTLKSLGHNLSPTTLTNWYHWAKESYLIGTASIYSQSLKQEEQNYKKIYSIDWAMANAISSLNEITTTKNLESIIYWELIRRGYEVSYFLSGRNKYEIDFIANKPNQKPDLAIQVCLDLSHPDTLERELRAFENLETSFSGIDKQIITLYPFDQPSSAQIIPATTWLTKWYNYSMYKFETHWTTDWQYQDHRLYYVSEW